tara:strand:+ start:1667 stop:1915 length:249 start_codon:yes stop_codon:yes gene_type:complete
MPIPEKIIIPASKDPGEGHFAVSIVKSIFRFVASGMLCYAGYSLWSENNYSDIFIAEAGFMMMCAGAIFFIAEVLGIIEEIV